VTERLTIASSDVRFRVMGNLPHFAYDPTPELLDFGGNPSVGLIFGHAETGALRILAGRAGDDANRTGDTEHSEVDLGLAYPVAARRCLGQDKHCRS
jgi:hypothetical protein